MSEPALLLSDPYEVNRRLAMMNEPHMKSLTRFVETLRKNNPDGYVPSFDPLDGGINARMLFLMEKPGKKGSTSSGIMGRDNDTQSCKNMRRFFTDAGIDRRDTLMWNVVPVWNGTQAIRVKELADGIASLNELLKFLPNLSIIVCVGRRAQSAEPLITRPGLTFFSSFHPSPNNCAAAYKDWLDIPNQWRKAQLYLEQQQAA